MATSPVELIVGPARSGKSGRVLEAYRRALDEAGPGGALMLVPTAARRRATETRLLAGRPDGVLMRPQILTLKDLADRLLSAAGQTVRQITELAQRQIIRQCLAGIPAKEKDALGPAIESPGLVVALDRLLRELKAARVEPDVFARALAGPARTPRNRLLARVYIAYQKALQERDVYDEAGHFWHAAALAQAGKVGPFGGLALLAVDGFQDFAPAQLDVLQCLADRAARTLITLTWDADRPNLFGVTGRTRERLLERFGGRLAETRVDEPAALPPEIARIRTHLFSLPDDAPRPAAGSALHVVSAAGRTREVEEAARRAVDLVRAGATAPASVGVLVRSLGPYAALVREVFPRFGVPFRVEAGRTLAEVPVIRAAMGLVRAQSTDFAFRTLARLLTSNYISPAAYGADAAAARAAVRLAREANVPKGRDAYLRGLADLARRLDREAGATDDSGEPLLDPARAAERREEIRRAADVLTRLFDLVTLPPKAARRDYARRLRGLFRTAGLWTAAAVHPLHQTCARDLKALAALEGVLDDVALLDDGGEPVTLEEFLDDVTQGLDLVSIAAEEARDAPVVVMDVRQSRALAFDHVLALGMGEKEFPRRGRQHPFFDDGERDDLRGRGVDLAPAGHAADEEMLLFYMAATRARQTLVLSYSALDSQGRPALPSHYLEEAAALFDDSAGPPLAVTDVGTRDLDLPADRLRSRRDLLARTLFALWGPGENPHIDRDLAVLGGLLPDGRAAESALAGLAAEWEREHGDAFGPFDGVLSAPDILDDLSRRYPGATLMSAARLERFGGCPFAFLAAHVLSLEALPEPSADLGPMDLGLIYHGLLERFFRAAGADAALAGRVTPQTLDAALALLDKTARAYFAQLAGAGRTGSAALWGVQSANILTDVRRLLAWHADKLAEWRVAHLEVAFGGASAGPVAPPGSVAPLELDGPHGPVRLRGRIDRIDLGPDGVQVIDYKMSAAPSRAAMQAGASLQLPIYLLAARRLLPPAIDDEDGRETAFFLPIRSPAQSGKLKSTDAKGNPAPKFGETMERSVTYIHRFIDAMRRGVFPVYPRVKCPGHCDFQGICRYSEWRIQAKWDAHPLAGLENLAPSAAGADEEADA